MPNLRGDLYRTIDLTLLSRLQEEPHEDVVETLVDAVIEALNAHTTVEWAYRYPNGHVTTWISALMTEDIARRMAAEHPDLLTVVRRRVSPWEDADA